MSGSEPLEVVDSMGHGDYLKVVVRDSRDGNHFKVDFLSNLQGEYKHDGGGGYKPWREDIFEAAKTVAGRYVVDTLGYKLVPRDEWTHVKVTTAKRIIERSDEFEVRPVETKSDREGDDGE